jgi:SMODS and SLOG-associating 2TM effector domain family 4
MTTITNGRDAKNGERSLALSTPVEDERYVLESQVRECYGRCAYSHKTHEKMAERHATWLRRFKWLQIILAALTTGGAVTVLFDRDSFFFAFATALLAILLLIANSYMKDLDPGQVAQKHREAASDIWNVREAYLSLLTDIRDPKFPLPELRKRRDDLQRTRFIDRRHKRTVRRMARRRTRSRKRKTSHSPRRRLTRFYPVR